MGTKMTAIERAAKLAEAAATYLTAYNTWRLRSSQLGGLHPDLWWAVADAEDELWSAINEPQVDPHGETVN